MDLCPFRHDDYLKYPTTIAKMFWARAAIDANREAALIQKSDHEWQRQSWQQLADQVSKLASGLDQLHIGDGDHVAIHLPTCSAWEAFDYALTTIGAVSICLYDRDTQRQTAALLNRYNIPIIITSSLDEVTKLIEAGAKTLRLAITLSPLTSSDEKAQNHQIRVSSIDELMSMGENVDSTFIANCLKRTHLDSLHTIVFTSGSMGEPKGVMLSHRNFVSVVTKLKFKFPGVRPRMVSNLPLSHVLQRTGLYRRLTSGFVTSYPLLNQNIDQTLTSVNPHMFATVPRVLEKLHRQIHDFISKQPAWKQRLFKWGVDVGHRSTQSRQEELFTQGKRPAQLRISHAFAQLLIYLLLRPILGTRIRLLGCGGATLDPNVEKFFWAIGIRIIQGYGLTETTAPATANRPNRPKLGTVGKALKGVELKIAEDGEILIRGESIFQGYYQDSSATEEALKDGWFYSGDLGEIDSDGYLTITGRKKEWLVLSNGKKVHPGKINAMLHKLSCVRDVCVLGDGYSFIIALVFVDRDCSKGTLRIQLRQSLAEINAGLSHYEQVRKIGVVPESVLDANDLLTPTLKLKRHAVAEHFTQFIKQMYESNDQDIFFLHAGET